jgi:ubiquinone/menaquinone biosynthesis C-methylase UbiE
MPAADDPVTWDANAAVYARQEHLEARAVAALLRLAAPSGRDRVLDVATGIGLVLRTLAARGARPAAVLGVDRSPGMLERAGPLPAGWTLRAGDATALPVPDGAVDLVTCAYLLHLQSPADRTATLREIRRVLTPEGRVVLVTPWSPRRVVRAACRSAAGVGRARLGGLRPLDPTAALDAAGLTPERRVVLPRGGYPSLVVLARR